MTQVNIYEAKAQFSALLTRVENGEEFVIARNGRPVAKIIPLRRPPAGRAPGTWRGKITMSPDFDRLDDADLADWYGTQVEPAP